MASPNTTIPSWFRTDFFSSILQKNSGRQIQVKSFDAEPAVAAGNNYSCILYRVKVQYEAGNESSQLSLIIKTPLEDGKANEMIKELGIVSKEQMMYNELVPVMEKIINKKLTPTCYPCPLPDTLILEDLKEQGYVMCDRAEQLDLDHCLIFMKTIATFHAASVYINKLNPELMQRVGTEQVFVDNFNDKGRKYIMDSCDKLATVVEEWGGFKEYADIYKNKVDQLLDKWIALHKETKHLVVLNHGDAWVNNMLFKYDTRGRVTDVKLIDLQMSSVASPALDLITFITSSAQENVQQNNLLDLYSVYLESFNLTLKSLGCDERLTNEELQDELKFAECWYLFVLPTFLPGVLSDKDNATNLDDLLESDNSEAAKSNAFYKVLREEKFERICKNTLRMLDQQSIVSSL